MKKLVLLLLLGVVFNFSSWAQPDYSQITFRTKIKEYKKEKPNLEGLEVNRELLKNIVTLLGSSFYTEEEILEITEKAWLSFIDPKQFDYVFKDLAVRTIPNWNKKNVRGLIVVEPNPFLKEWTLANNEQEYFHEALSKILIYYNLMGYGEDAKKTKKSLKKLLYTKKMYFKNPSTADWTNSYLKAANQSLHKKNLITFVTNGGYDFFVCDKNKKDELLKLFGKMDWRFINP